MARRFDLVVNQIMEADGDAISGAQLFFYETGTSTKLDTYTDDDLTTANTNPVVADSAGRFGPIFLQAQDYQVILAPAADTDPPASPIWTKDPIHGADVPTNAGQCLSYLDAGIVEGDTSGNATANSAALATQIAAGQPVCLGIGTFYFTTNTWTQAGGLIGPGKDLTDVKFTGAGFVVDTATQTDIVQLKGFTVQASTGAGITWNNGRLHLESVESTANTDDGLAINGDTGAGEGAYGGKIIDFQATANSDDGISITGRAYQTLFLNVEAESNVGDNWNINVTDSEATTNGGLTFLNPVSDGGPGNTLGVGFNLVAGRGIKMTNLIQRDDGGVTISANISDSDIEYSFIEDTLSNSASSANTQVYEIGTPPGSSVLIALNDLTDVDTSGATTGQVLTRKSDGTYNFQDGVASGSGGGGVLSVIDTVDLSSTLELTNLGGGDFGHVIIYLEGLTCTGAALPSLKLQASDDGGSSYDTAANYFEFGGGTVPGGWSLTDTGLINDAANGSYSAIVHLTDFNTTTHYAHIYVEATYGGIAAGFAHELKGEYLVNGTALNALKLVLSAGSMSGGTAVVLGVDSSADTGLPAGFVSTNGFAISLDTDTDHDVLITAGEARDDSDTYNVVLSAALTKRIDAAWAVGDDMGGMATGTVTTDTWYTIWLIRQNSGGTIDAMLDISSSGANVPAGWTVMRRIGAVLTDGSSNIRGFKQYVYGNIRRYLFDNPALEIDVTNQGTTAVARTLAVPPAINALAKVNMMMSHASAQTLLYVRNPDTDDEAPSASAAPLATMATGDGGTQHACQREFLCDTSQQVETEASQTSVTLRMSTLGWEESI